MKKDTDKSKETKEDNIRFSDVVPTFSGSVSGSQICIKVSPIIGASGYEIYRKSPSEKSYESMPWT